MLVFAKKPSVLEEEELLRMVDIEFIRKKHFVEGWSIRKIARNLGISRQSVRKALASKARYPSTDSRYRGRVL